MSFEELKQRQAAMWGSAPFERIAVTLADMHQSIVRGVGGAEGDRWLDVGCGTGELAFMAAATGADVTGVDLSPGLAETSRRQAAERGVPMSVDVGDAESLPYPDDSFDVVTSSVGAIFAPDHGAVADELARVCRPGGRLGLTAWTTDGRVDRFFEIIASFAPAPPPDAGSPMQWGDAEYCRSLLGDAFDVEITAHNTPWRTESPDEMWTEMSEAFGPIKTLLAAMPPEPAEAFRTEMMSFFQELEAPGGGVVIDRVYNLAIGTRRT